MKSSVVPSLIRYVLLMVLGFLAFALASRSFSGSNGKRSRGDTGVCAGCPFSEKCGPASSLCDKGEQE